MSAVTSSLSRREFLGTVIVAGTALTVGRSALSAEQAASGERWVLLSDIHISQDRAREARGIKPVEKLAEARTQILALEPRPTGVIISGDCAYDRGEAGDYAVLKEELKPFDDAGIPIHMAMGNHDNRERFWAAFPESKALGTQSGLEKHVYVVEGRDVDWFILDSNIETGIVYGEMGGPQLAWLAAELDKRPDKPALLVAHHYPSVKSDDNGLRDCDALWNVIQPRKRVKAYLFGHSHSWTLGEREGLHIVNIPAVAWLFDEAQPRAWVEASSRPDGMALRLHCLNDVHPANEGRCDLPWKA